jgi:hypothetical protein
VKFGEPPKPHRSLSDAAKQLISHQMRHWRTRRTLAHEYLGFRDSARELRAAQALGAIPLIVVSRGKRVWPENTRGNLLEHLWLELQTDLADQSPWSAHIVAGNSGHQVHLDQPKLVAYSVAVITDIHRLHHHEEIGDEYQEPTNRARLEFRAATWLRDSLTMGPEVAIPVINVSRNLD